MERQMFYGAKKETFEKAKTLRENMTDAEKNLWQRLNKSQLGVRFKAQHPISIFIADFYCHQHKLVIEVDGEIHEYQKEYDYGREMEMEKFEIKTIRFSNQEIFSDIEIVIAKIKNEICPQPPKGGFKKNSLRKVSFTP